MTFVGCSLLDPFPQQRHVALGQRRLLRFRRRHHLLGIVGEDALDHLTGVGLAGGDRRVTTEIPQRALAGVEAQLGLAILFVRPVADEAVVGEKRADVLIEPDAVGQGIRRAQRQRGQQQNGKMVTAH